MDLLVKLGALYVDDIRKEDIDAANLALINTIPQANETGVLATAPVRLQVVSLVGVALDTTTKVYFTYSSTETKVLVYDQAGGGFQSGYSGTASITQSPGSAVNDELTFSISHTADFASEEIVTVEVQASVTGYGSVIWEYAFTVEDLTKPQLDSILWVTPRRCRLKFTEPMKTGDEPGVGGTLFLAHVDEGLEIVDTSTIQLARTVPNAAWVSYWLQLTGSCYPQNNTVHVVSAVDATARTVTVATANLVPDDGVDKNAQGTIVRERRLRMTVSPYRLVTRMDEEGASEVPESEERIQCAYVPLPVAAALPYADEISTADVQAQYVVLDFHDDISFGRLYTMELDAGLQDLSDNVFTSPTFGAPANRIKMWDFYPQRMQLEDLKFGGEFRKMIVVLQDLFNSLWYRVDQLQHVPDPSTCPEHLLDFLLHSMGNPFRFALDTPMRKRKLAEKLKEFYRRFGLTGGIEDILEFFLGGHFEVEPFVTLAGWTIGEHTLGLDTMLAGGSKLAKNQYQVRAFASLNADELASVIEIATYADPVNMHLARVIDPTDEEWTAVFWTLGQHVLGYTTMLFMEP
jgi:phage tail-like protein